VKQHIFMNNLNLKVKINEIWHELTPTFNDFSIEKVRDDKQIFVMRTSASGNMFFYCEDFELLYPYVGEQLEGELTEMYCDDTIVYDCFLNLSNTYNESKKKITAKIIIKDKYWYLENNQYNGKSINSNIDLYNYIFGGQTLIDIDNRIDRIFGLPLINILDIGIVSGSSIKYISVDYYKPRATYSFKFMQDLDIEELYFTSIKNLRIFNSDTKCEGLMTSAVELFELIRTKFFSGFYLSDYDESQERWYIIFEWFGKNSLFSNGIDLTTFENKNDTVITFKNQNKVGNFQYKTFEYKEDIDNLQAVKYATTNVNFNENGNVNVIPDANSDLSQVNKDNEIKSIFQLEKTNDFILLSDLSKQFYNDSWDYAEGDFDELILKNYTAHTGIINTSTPPLDGTYVITFWTDVPNNSDLYISVNGIQQQVQNGTNSLTFHNASNRIAIITNNSAFSWIKITHFEVKIYPDVDYLRAVNNSVKLAPVKLISNWGAEMPSDEANINNIDYPVLKSNTFEQQITFDYNKCIGNYDEFKLMKTSKGWLRVDKISRKYGINYNSLTTVILSGK